MFGMNIQLSCWKKLKNRFSEQVKNFQVQMIYDNFETDLMTEESTGIKQLFKMLCPIMDILINGKILVCGEIEAGLHESIVHQLVKYIL